MRAARRSDASAGTSGLSRHLRLAVLLLVLASFSGCAYYNTFYLARKYYNQGLEEEKKNTTGRLSPQAAERFEKSLRQAEKILVRYPNSKWMDDALFLMGRAYYGREEFGSARARFDELITRYPKSDFATQARFWIGRTYFAEGDYVKAIETFNSVESEGLDPAWGDDVVFYLGEVSFAREDYEAALKRYQEVVSRYPNGRRTVDAMGRIGDAYFERRQYAEARESYEMAMMRVVEAKDRFTLRIKIGQCLEKEQQFDAALSLYRETAYELVGPDKFDRIMADPNELDRSALDQLVRDQSALNQNAAIDPENPPAANAGTTDAQRLQQEQQLRAQLGESNRRAAAEAIASNPLAAQLPRILLRQGLCLSAAGDQKAAIQTFRSVVTAFPRTAEAGEAQYRIGYVQEVEFQDYAAARKSYDEVKQQGSSLFTEQATRRATGLTRLIALAAADTAGGAGATKSLEAEAERAFLAAELFLFQHDKPEKALDAYALVETDYPTTSFAPRAALARAWILDHTLADTAAAAEVYRSMVEKYPGTDPWRVAYEIVKGEPAPREEPKPATPADGLLAAAGGAPPPDSLAAGGPAAGSTIPVATPAGVTPPGVATSAMAASASGDSAGGPRPPVAPGGAAPALAAAEATALPEIGAGNKPEDIALRNEALRVAAASSAAASNVLPAANGAANAAANPAATAAVTPAGTTAGAPAAAAAVSPAAIQPGVPHRMPSRVAARNATGLPKAWVEWQRALERARPRSATSPPVGGATGKAAAGKPAPERAPAGSGGGTP